MIVILGRFLGIIINFINRTYKLKRFGRFSTIVFLGSIWFIPSLRSLKVSKVRLVRGNIIQKVGDKGWYEYFGSQGIYFRLRKLFNVLNFIQLEKFKSFIKVFVFSLFLIRVYFYMCLYNLIEYCIEAAKVEEFPVSNSNSLIKNISLWS